MELWIIGGLVALIIWLATAKAKSDVRKEISSEVLERAKRAKKNRTRAKRKSVIDKLRSISKKRNK